MTPVSEARATWSKAYSSHAMAVYEEILVPRLFDPWAELIVDMLEISEGERVLDVACGPGTVARIAAREAGPTGRVTGTDLSPAMLDIARAKPPVQGGAKIEYGESPAAPLAVDDDAYDVACCQQGLQFFPDRPAALREMLRALRGGGRAGIAVWTEVEESPPFAAVARGVEEAVGNDLASMYRGGPWGLNDADELRRLFESAGFTDVRVSSESLPFVLDGGAAQIVDSLAVSGIAEQIAGLPDEALRRLTDAVTETLAAITEDGVIRSHATSNVAIARKP
jgi:ubiquinone/menaquinone biosynthesis C-methylase UbiE